MTKSWLGTVIALMLAAASARAADLPVKGPPAVPQWNWTGFYLGGEVGAKWEQTTWSAASLSNLAGLKTIDASSPANYEPSGARVGGYFGYNWQFAPQWVGGLEFDGAYANDKATATGLPGCAVSCNPTAGGGVASPSSDLSSVTMGWDVSARARLGYLVTPTLLLYGTGGVAWQNFQTSGTCVHSVADPLCLVAQGFPSTTASNSETRTGWTVGIGLETAIYGNWLLRGEYRYSDFGTFNGVFNFDVPGVPPGQDTYRYRLRVNTQIATFGLGYKF